jgi:hypothetical protein
MRGAIVSACLATALAAGALAQPPVDAPENRIPGYQAPPGLPGYEPTTDPRDLRGVWRSRPPPGTFPLQLARDPPLTAEARAQAEHQREMAAKGTPLATPHVMCRPAGVSQEIVPIAPVYILQNDEKIVFIVTDEIRDVRQAFFADAHPANVTPTYGGDSIARWDGDVLVVDTIGFNGRGELGGTFHGTGLHLVQRFGKSADGKTLHVEATIEDPETLTEPLVVQVDWTWLPGRQPLEFDCEENPREDNFADLQFDGEQEYLRPVCVQHEGEGDELSKVVCAR